MKRVVVTLIVGALTVGQAWSQSIPQLLRLADAQFEKNRYLDAIPYYDKVYGIDKKNEYAGYQLAQCYEYTLQYAEALKRYKKLSETASEEYFAQSVYKYATLNKLESNFDIADSIYQELAKFPTISPELLELANGQREGCLIAKRAQAQDRKFEVNYLKKLNSNYHDFGAAGNPVTGDVVFATTRNLSGEQYVGSQFAGLLPDMLMYERKDNGGFQNISGKQKFDKLNTKWSEGSGCFSQNGQRFYYTSCESKGNTGCKILVTTLVDDKWSKPEPLNEYINEKNAENKQPSLSVTGDTLFFASDRPGGFGGSDIWMSLRGDSIDAWTPAINLGDVINTQENEISPYYSSAHESLLFSSNGHVGYGGYDIYGAKGSSFYKPDLYNIGHPFNSTLDDTYFNITDSTGYLSSNRKDKEVLNLYDFEVPGEKLFLALLFAGEMLIDGQLVSKFRNAGAVDLVTFRAEDYEGYELFQPIVTKKKDLRKLFNESDVAGNSIASNFMVSSSRGKSKYTPAERKEVIKKKIYKSFDNVDRLYFDYSLATLKPQYQQALKEFYLNIKDQAYSQINLLSYADHLGAEDKNMTLSRKRGEAVKAYLVSLGMPEDKISVLARGEAHSEAEKDHWYRRILDRKVELHVEASESVQLPAAKGLVVRQSMTLDGIAQKLNLTAAELKTWNCLGNVTVQPGETIRAFIPKDTDLNARYFVSEETVEEVLR